MGKKPMNQRSQFKDVTVVHTVAKIYYAIFSSVSSFLNDVLKANITMQSSLRKGCKEWLDKFLKVRYCHLNNIPLLIVHTQGAKEGLYLQEVSQIPNRTRECSVFNSWV